MLTTLLIALATMSLLMCLVWVIYLRLNNPGIMDACWPIAIALSACIFMGSPPWPPIQFMLFGCLLLWAIRLSGYLLTTRVLKQHIEKRYLTLAAGWRLKAKWGFLGHFQCQGLLALLIATPFIWIAQLPAPAYATYLALVLIIIGLLGETLSDYQLHRHKTHYPGTLCDTGLWGYSRHPNYFFELMIWFGFGLAGFNIHPLSALSPCLLLFIMAKLTGPITEKAALTSKGAAYEAYQQRTRMIIPWPKKK
jgi:steroid 5-alpha reductase family enzyme